MGRHLISFLLIAVVAICIVAAKPPPQKKHYHYQKTYHNYPSKGHHHHYPSKQIHHKPIQKPVQKPLQKQPAKVMSYTKKGYMPIHVPVNVPTYEFGYKVHDPQHKNFQEKTETKIGDAVQGYYSLLQPNGEVRVVRYQSDDSGFRSKVTLHKHQDGRAGRVIRV